MKKMLSIAVLLAGAALLAGCPKKATVAEPPTAGTQVPGAGGAGASTSTSPLGADASANGMGANGVYNRARWPAISFISISTSRRSSRSLPS